MRKNYSQNFWKLKKIYILEPFWALLCQVWAKMNFPGKKSCQFSNILLILPKSSKKSEKTNEPNLRKMPNQKTDGQTDNGDFIGSSVGQRSNNGLKLTFVKFSCDRNSDVYFVFCLCFCYNKQKQFVQLCWRYFCSKNANTCKRCKIVSKNISFKFHLQLFM